MRKKQFGLFKSKAFLSLAGNDAEIMIICLPVCGFACVGPVFGVFVRPMCATPAIATGLSFYFHLQHPARAGRELGVWSSKQESKQLPPSRKKEK